MRTRETQGLTSRKLTLNPKRVSKVQLARLKASFEYPENEPHPRTRADCKGGPRPCPWVSCTHHLYLDVSPNGAITLNFPDRELEDLEETCALDVADAGGATLERTGNLINLTRERARQIETAALNHLDPSSLIEHLEEDIVDTLAEYGEASCPCGTTFTKVTPDQTFCTRECPKRPGNVRSTPNRNPRAPAGKGFGTGVCPACGTSFKRNSGRHTYCNLPTCKRRHPTRRTLAGKPAARAASYPAAPAPPAQPPAPAIAPPVPPSAPAEAPVDVMHHYQGLVDNRELTRELAAMAKLVDLLEPLEGAARRCVLAWATARYL